MVDAGMLVATAEKGAHGGAANLTATVDHERTAAMLVLTAIHEPSTAFHVPPTHLPRPSIRCSRPSTT